MENARFHRAFRAVRDVGDFAVGQVLVERQMDDLPVLLGQSVEAVANRLYILGRRERVHGVGIGHFFSLLQSLGLVPALASDSVERLVPGDAEQPAAHRRPALKARRRPPCLMHDLYDYVAGFERIVHARQNKSEQGGFVAPVENRERVLVAAGHAGQQAFIGLRAGIGHVVVPASSVRTNSATGHRAPARRAGIAATA